jgi:DNA-binding NtrC family response regulator
MQQESGLDLLPVVRASGRSIAVIMISSASDAATVQTSLHYGVVDYLIKPFQFSRFEEALTAWRAKKQVANTAARIGQREGWLQRAETVRQQGMATIARSAAERWFTSSVAVYGLNKVNPDESHPHDLQQRGRTGGKPSMRAPGKIGCWRTKQLPAHPA